MTGLALWRDAGPNTRDLFIRLACDGDFRGSLTHQNSIRNRLTIAQALEVLK